jgi:hypothetical protein
VSENVPDKNRELVTPPLSIFTVIDCTSGKPAMDEDETETDP